MASGHKPACLQVTKLSSELNFMIGLDDGLVPLETSQYTNS